LSKNDIFALPNFVGTLLVKLVSTWSPWPRATFTGKVSWGYATTPTL